MNMKLLCKKLVQNLRTEKRTLAVNLGILAVSFLAVTAVVTLLANLSRAISGAEDHFQLTVYLKDGAPEERTEALVDAIGKFPEVRSVTYLSRGDFKKKFLEGAQGGRSELASLGDEVFPATLQVRLSPGFMDRASASGIIKKLGKVDIVEDVGYHENWLRNLSGFLKVLWAGFLVFGIFILVSSIFAMSNMIQLAFSKRLKAIRIMRLCGATPAFIEVPVLLEGLFLGLTAGLASLLLTWASLALLNHKLAAYLGGIFSIHIHFLPPLVMALLVAACAATGMGGAWIASRKVLRV
jgi:cell division transport system permease protein